MPLHSYEVGEAVTYVQSCLAMRDGLKVIADV